MKLINRTYLLLFGIMCFIAVVYYPSIYNGFTNWDDPIHITENHDIQSLSWSATAALFKPSDHYMYHPLTMVTYMVDWYVGKGQPFTFHITSLLLHFFNVVLVFFLIKKISSDDNVALLVSLLFGVHPINVETVAWLSARKDILYSFFLLLGSILYLKYTTDGKRTKYIVGLFGCFILGLLSKPTMMVFPILMFVFDWYNEKKILDSLGIKLSALLIAVVYGIFTIYLTSTSDVSLEFPIRLYPLHQQIQLLCYAAVFYFTKIFLPFNFSACYSYPHLQPDGLPWQFVLAPAAVVLLIVFVVLLRKNKYIVFGSLLYLLPLFFVLQIVPFHNSALVADRYSYFSTIGIFFIVFMAIKNYIVIPNKIFLRMFLLIAVIPVVIYCSGLTYSRISVWKNSEILFTDVIEKNNTLWLAYGNRADGRMRNGDYEGALKDCNTALLLKPTVGKLYYSRGNVFSFLKDYKQTIVDYDSALKLGEATKFLFYNKALAFIELNLIDSALHAFKNVNVIDSTYSPAYSGIGDLLIRKKDYAAAKKYLDTALHLDNKNNHAHYLRGNVYLHFNNYTAALQDFSQLNVTYAQIAKDSLLTLCNRRISILKDSINTVTKIINENPKNASLFFAQRARLRMALGDSANGNNDLRWSQLQ